ncbi:HrpD5 family protein [Trinickia caryophylli]|uniref:Type III secretion protein D n=1 Tax=Trinickia caryophylli TaxID=28094 RepID=A0A1X7EDB3_TRICW|nr:HrpD5 family protein [Trinickia caryophylli]PMS12886.1 type III secretion system protein [Trinickia caryophylli]WQE14483.1 HrpD5 family protein [Trinickia caryophylli]GLU32113.1 type III secretion protein [Trinickia caryophylli]SMF31929.1 type III secretion protein D [Trinickia caryophylli]
MKILRILTGTHAGIQARLTPGRYRIGKADDTDICITDWDDDDVLVELDEQGVISARRADATAPDQSVVRIPDFVAFPFGTTVLCFGDENAPWPPDIELLAGMYHGTGAAQVGDRDGAGHATPARRRVHALLVVAMLAALLVAGGSVIANVWPARSAPPAPRDARSVAAKLQQQLHDAHIVGLRARAQGDTVVVDGIVDEISQDIAARALLVQSGYHAVARQYDVAHNDVSSIQESIGIDGVHVRYAGDGVFEVTGVAPSLARLEAALSPLRADLNANIKRVDINVAEAPEASVVLYSATLDVGGTRYVQTTDGVKHVFTAGTGNFAGGPRTLRESITPSRGEIH